MQRLQDEGRVVTVDGLDAPIEQPPPLERPKAVPTGSMRQFGFHGNGNENLSDTAVSNTTSETTEEPKRSTGKWVMNKR